MAAAFLFVWGFYFFIDWQHRKNNGEGSALFKRLCKKEKLPVHNTVWRFVRRVVDSKFFAYGFIKNETGHKE